MEGGSTLEIALDAAGLVRARWERSSQANVDVVSRLNLDREQLDLNWEPDSYGRCLGEALFQGRLRNLWEKVLAEPGVANISLNVIDAPLTRCNWGWLQGPIAGDWQFLGLSQRIRYSMYPVSEQDLSFPKMARTESRALLLVAAPPQDNDMSLASFDDRQVVASIGAALADHSSVDVYASQAVTNRKGPATLEALAAALSRRDYPILHLVAHGQVLDDGTQAIYLTKEDGSVDGMAATRLVEVLAHCRYPPRLVVLSSCHSADPDGRTGRQAGNLAWCLAAEVGVHCVVAMTERVTLDSAGDLTRPFYENLFKHGTVEQALAEARASLCRREDVMVPVVYSRLRGQPLFQPTAEGTVAVELDPLEIPALKIKQQRHLIFGLITALLMVMVLFSYWHHVLSMDKLNLEAEQWLATAFDANNVRDWKAGYEKASEALQNARRMGEDQLANQALMQQRRAAYHLPKEEFWFKHPEPLLFHAWSSQGILTISPNMLRHWQRGKHEPILNLKIEQGKLTAIALARDDRYLVTAAEQGSLWLWSLEQGQVIRALHDFSHAQRELHFSPDNTWIYTTDGQGFHFRWDVASGTLQNLPQKPEWLESPTDIVEPSNLLARRDNGQVIVRGNMGGQPLMTLPSHVKVVDLLGFRGSILTVLEKNGTVSRWTSELLANTTPILQRDANQRVLDVYGHRTLIANARGVGLWEGDQQVASGHNDRVLLGRFSQNGKQALTLDRQGKAFLWQVPEYKPLEGSFVRVIEAGFAGEEPWIATFREIIFPVSGRHVQLDYKAGKPYVVAVCEYRKHYLVNQHLYTKDGKRHFSIDTRPEIAMIRDSTQTLVTAALQGVSIWNLQGKRKKGLALDSRVTSMDLNETGTHLSVGTEESRAYVYDLAKERLTTTIDVLNGPITQVSFDGDELITVDNNNLRRWLWRLDP